MAGNFFRGTSVEQDGRFGKSDEKLLASMSKAGKFSAILETKVNLKKVNLDVMSKWITAKIIQLVGFEDDILINLVINMLEGEVLDPKKMQLDVTGFLEKQAQSFVEELWTLLVDAQNQQSGIPMAFIEKKKEEILLREEAKKQQQQQASLSNAQNAPTKYGLQTGSTSERREDVDRISDRRADRKDDSRRKDEHRDDHRDEHRRRDSRDDDQHRRHRRVDSPSRREGRGGDRDSRRRDHSEPRRRDRSPERSSRNRVRETPSESPAEKVQENVPTVQSDAGEKGVGSDRKAHEKRERSPDRHRRHDSRDRRSHRERDSDRRYRRADSSEERRRHRRSGDRRESRKDGRGVRNSSKERGDRSKDVKKRRRSGSSSSSSSDDSLVPL